ncbi:MAG: hypothetical protein JKY37_19380, partial [Nannocystaceae bacterium]|nr:hypothetical protein [Nannocystaceae bacterium]
GRGDVVHAGQAWRIDERQQWHAVELTLDHLPKDVQYASVAPRALAMVGRRLWVTLEISAPSLNRLYDGPCHALASAVL